MGRNSGGAAGAEGMGCLGIILLIIFFAVILNFIYTLPVWLSYFAVCVVVSQLIVESKAKEVLTNENLVYVDWNTGEVYIRGSLEDIAKTISLTSIGRTWILVVGAVWVFVGVNIVFNPGVYNKLKFLDFLGLFKKEVGGGPFTLVKIVSYITDYIVVVGAVFASNRKEDFYKEIEKRRELFTNIFNANTRLIEKLVRLEKDLDGLYSKFGLNKQHSYLQDFQNYVFSHSETINTAAAARYLEKLIKEAEQEIARYKDVSEMYKEARELLDFVRRLLRKYPVDSIVNELESIERVFYSKNFLELIRLGRLEEFKEICEHIIEDLEDIKHRVEEFGKFFGRNGKHYDEKFVWACQVLGISPNAHLDEVKGKYHSLVKQYHPDKHYGSKQRKVMEQKFIEIKEAYETILKYKKEV